MLKTLQKYTKHRKYILVHNGEKMNFQAQRINGFKEYINLLAKTPELKETTAFFIYNEPNFASFGMSEPLDIIWVNWDGKIIHLEESFEMNKISQFIDKTKFIYILPIKSIKKNKILINDTLTHEYKRSNGEYKISDFV